MNSFSYYHPENVSDALDALDRIPGGKFIAGGTNLLDLWKMGVEQPKAVIDLNHVGLTAIEELPAGMRLGALARNSDVAEHPVIVQRYPALSQALLSGASPQLRNAATVAGNLMQRTRCYYFYDPAFPSCNKRSPGTGCGALRGFNRIHAIFGQSDSCVATHPSDMSVALLALDATVRTRSKQGEREIPLREFHRLPGNTPQMDTNLRTDEVVTAVDLPSSPFAARSLYLKVRDRSNFAFALVSLAAALHLKDGKIEDARLALGGVAHKPWRALEAEGYLRGKRRDESGFRAAADLAVRSAAPLQYNAFKVELVRRLIIKGCTLLTA